MSTPHAVDRYCSKCGLSLLPLDVPHLSSPCTECGRTVHFVRRGPDGQGIRVEQGERFTIPAGFIQISLDPASRGKLFRPGLSFLLKQLFLGDHPKQTDDPSLLTSRTREQADAILRDSERLKGLDLENEADAQRALERLKDVQESRDWHAMTMGAMSQMVDKAVGENDSKGAAWSGYMLGTVRGLTIVTEPLFEQTLWRGYLANQVVYESAAAASQTPGEAEAIKQLEPLFRRLDEATLHAWVDSKLPIGPRIGVKALPEEIIAALARWHLASFQREREQSRLARADKRADWELRLKWLASGLALGGAIVSGLKYFGAI